MEQVSSCITTFYSYKGGTGRSMALANFAWIVAASGKRVLAIDWDLEAPGLHRYFRPFLIDPDLFETDGLIDTFWSLAASALARDSSGEWRTTPVDSDEVAEAIEDAVRPLTWKFATGGYIDFIGAGRQGPTYSERVNSFDWKRFYDLGGARVLTATKEHLRERYDWVLIDSRTGVSDTSGICTVQMPEVVVPCFTLNRQSIDGLAAILQSIRAFRSPSVDGSKIDFFPVATRIENAEQARLEVARGYARTMLADFLPRNMKERPREYWDKMEISYRPAYAFEEVLAGFGDATGATGAADTMLSQVEVMAQCITGDDRLRMPEIDDADREDVLQKYRFGALSASATNQTNTVPDTADRVFLRGVRRKEELWRNSGFSWRLLLSRRELDLLTDDDRRKFGRGMTFYLLQSDRMQLLLRTVQIVAPVSFLFVLAFFLILLIISPELRYALSIGYWPDVARTTLAFICTWMFATVGWSIFAARDRPYGVNLFQVSKLSLMVWPWRRDISDYDPNKEPTLRRADDTPS